MRATWRRCAAIEPLLTLHTLLIAPYTCDGHPDHEAVGRVCCEVAKQHGTTLAQYLIWAWHRLTPSDLPHVRWGKFTLDFEAQRAKAHAVQCFASQLAPAGRPPVVPRHVLAYFQRAYEAFIL
jgi:LmbE family N-acetylglucosaminyl deacetylase